MPFPRSFLLVWKTRPGTRLHQPKTKRCAKRPAHTGAAFTGDICHEDVIPTSVAMLEVGIGSFDEQAGRATTVVPIT